MNQPTDNELENILNDLILVASGIIIVSENQKEKALTALRKREERLIALARNDELKWYKDLICEYDEGSDWAEHTLDRIKALTPKEPNNE